jgi:Calcineurin-like phosphoesterase
VLAAVFPLTARGDETFAVVGDYGSSGEGPNAVVQQAAQGVATRLNLQSPSFLLSMGDQLYGTYPKPVLFGETQPLQPTGAPSYSTAVGPLYDPYIKQSALVPGGGLEMNFFPVLGDHDWWHETIQVDEGTGFSVGSASDGYDTSVNITTDRAFYTNAQAAYASAQSYLAGANTDPSNTQFGLRTTTPSNAPTIFGSPNTTINGDSYESYFSALYNLTTSQTPSTAPLRWYDTLQGSVHVFALSNDPNEIYQGGLNTINIQDSGSSATNLSANPQGQWFSTALANSTATWNIVQMHQPVATASAPEDGYYTTGIQQGHLSTAYMQWFDGTDVDLVIAGHVHGYERLYNNGITYINNGVGGSFEAFAVFCNQLDVANTCTDTYQVAPAFGGLQGTTWSNHQMLDLTQMQVGSTYGFQLVTTSDANNYLESQFWGSTDPGSVNNPANWTLIDDFFILKNGTIDETQAANATGLQLKAPNGVSTNGIGFGITGVPIAQDAALVEAGLDVVVAPDATLSLSYQGQLAGDIQDNGIRGNLDWRF